MGLHPKKIRLEDMPSAKSPSLGYCKNNNSYISNLFYKFVGLAASLHNVNTVSVDRI